MENKFFSLLKLFFPSWNFFGGSSDTPYLLVKVNSEYVPVFPPPQVGWSSFFFNPFGNLYLAHHSNMQSLLNEIYHNQDNPHFKLEDTPIYAIAKNWVEYYLFQNNINAKNYNFKFSYVKFNLDKLEILEDIFISPDYELL